MANPIQDAPTPARDPTTLLARTRREGKARHSSQRTLSVRETADDHRMAARGQVPMDGEQPSPAVHAFDDEEDAVDYLRARNPRRSSVELRQLLKEHAGDITSITQSELEPMRGTPAFTRRGTPASCPRAQASASCLCGGWPPRRGSPRAPRPRLACASRSTSVAPAARAPRSLGSTIC